MNAYHHRVAWLVASCVVLSLSLAHAHDRRMHQGKPLEGTLSAIAPSTLKVTSDAGETSVEVSPETSIERDGEPVSPAALSVGAHVLVFGPKLAGGAVAAREIVLRDDPEQKPLEPESPAQH